MQVAPADLKNRRIALDVVAQQRRDVPRLNTQIRAHVRNQLRQPGIQQDFEGHVLVRRRFVRICHAHARQLQRTDPRQQHF